MTSRRPRSRRPSSHLSVTVDGITLTGSAAQIVAKCEAIGYEAEREKDFVRMHRFFQTADHYKKVNENVGR